MMFSAKLFTIVTAVLAVAVNGSPIADNKTPAKDNGATNNGNGSTNESTGNKDQSGLGSVQLCADSGLKNCATVSVDAGVCKNVPTGFDNDISSAGIPQGVGCTFFDDINCGGKSVSLESTSNNLADVGFDDTTSSVKCNWL